MSKREIEFASVMELDQATAFLEDLVNSLKKGVVCLQKGSEFVVLNPARVLKVEVEAKKKKDKCKLSLELSWKGEMDAKSETVELKVLASLPESAGNDAEDQED